MYHNSKIQRVPMLLPARGNIATDMTPIQLAEVGFRTGAGIGR